MIEIAMHIVQWIYLMIRFRGPMIGFNGSIIALRRFLLLIILLVLKRASSRYIKCSEDVRRRWVFEGFLMVLMGFYMVL